MSVDIDAMVAEHIERTGWHATGVFPTENDPAETPGFVYTAGLAEKGKPELILFGLPARVGHSILHMAVQRLLDDDLELGRTTNLFEGLDAYLVDVRPSNWEQYLGIAMRRALSVDAMRAGPFRCWQIVWPDAENRFPWEANYSVPAWMQPVLGHE